MEIARRAVLKFLATIPIVGWYIPKKKIKFDNIKFDVELQGILPTTVTYTSPKYKGRYNVVVEPKNETKDIYINRFLDKYKNQQITDCIYIEGRNFHGAILFYNDNKVYEPYETWDQLVVLK